MTIRIEDMFDAGMVGQYVFDAVQQGCYAQIVGLRPCPQNNIVKSRLISRPSSRNKAEPTIQRRAAAPRGRDNEKGLPQHFFAIVLSTIVFPDTMNS